MAVIYVELVSNSQARHACVLLSSTRHMYQGSIHTPGTIWVNISNTHRGAWRNALIGGGYHNRILKVALKDNLGCLPRS